MRTNDLSAPRNVGLRGVAPRWLDTLMGVSLIAIAFDDTSSASTNGVVVGSCIIAVAAHAMFLPTLRWLNTTLAAWLMFSAVFVFEDVSSAAMRSQLFIGLVVLVSSVARDSVPRRPPGRPL